MVQGADIHVPAEVEQSMGVLNSGVVYALWDYSAEFGDELSFREGEPVTVLRRQPQEELNWWWGSLYGHEGYIPRNYFGVRGGATAPTAPGGGGGVCPTATP